MKVFARSGRKRHARRTDGMQLQFVAIGENCGNLAQIATARWADSTSAGRAKQVQMAQKSRVGMPVT